MRTLKQRCHQKGWGLNLEGCGDKLSNLRFADDVLLVGRSRGQVTKMLNDLQSEAAKVGLIVHMGKTKVMYNGVGCKGGAIPGHIDLNGERVEVLNGDEAIMYLGRALNLQDFHDTEIRHRMSKAWAKFGMYRNESSDKPYSLKSRLQLFQSVVMPSVLYGCGSWTMTAERGRILRTT